jgi:hypothetical protein
MKDVLDLLHEKNMHLEKFYRLNEAQLEKIAMREYETIDLFYANREGLLAVIKKLDEMVEGASAECTDATLIDDDMRAELVSILDYKNNLVARVLEQDLKILSAIEEEKNKIIKELTQVRAARKVVGTHGRNPDLFSLDEEA